MQHYEYSPLISELEEIRLLTLLPGKFDDDIRFEICHAPLVVPEAPQVQRMSLRELRDTVPVGWEVSQTLEGRYIFKKKKRNATFWSHPDPAVDPTRYSQPPAEFPRPDFEPKYEALSYAWGSTENVQTVYVESSVSSSSCQSTASLRSSLQIGPNLASALRHLRYLDKTRTLWVDAICINQKDKIERNVQVRRMANIYRLAERVVVWLGPEADDSKLALTALQFLGTQVECTKDYLIWRSPQATEQRWYSSGHKLPYDETLWLAIHCLATRPWFTRLWISQEIHFANIKALVQCGHDSILWSLFRKAGLCLTAKLNLPTHGFRNYMRGLRRLLLSQSQETFLTILRYANSRDCLDPRDKVYGLLGFANAKLANKVHPQYSLPVGEVYKNIFLVYLEHVHRLEQLISCRYQARLDQTPSWVPNWSRKLGSTFGAGQLSSGISAAQAQYHPLGILEVSGIRCATIESVSRSSALNTSMVLDGWRSLAPENMKQSSYIGGGSIEDAFVSTTRANCVKERYPTFRMPLWQEWKQLLFPKPMSSGGSLVQNNISQPKSSNGGLTQSDAEKNYYLSKSLHVLQNRAFIKMEEGYIGLGPPEAQPGDIACVILGCNSLIILRPVSTRTFHVIGTSYVHGLSDAVGLIGPLPEFWSVHIVGGQTGKWDYRLFNSATGKYFPLSDDPRLGPLPVEWEPVQRDRTNDDPEVFQWYRNTITGEEMNSDPRMLPEALKERGVPLQTFRLV